MDVISLSAIKKAKKEIVDLLNKIDGQTLQSMVLELRNTLSKLDREKLSAADFNQMMASIQEYLASKLDASISSRLSKADFDSWKAPWTGTRAAKLDNLDAKVSSRADGKDWTTERAGKVDLLDVAVSTRASGEDTQKLKEEAQNIRSIIGTEASRNLDTVMGRIGSIIGYGERVIYQDPGAHTFTVPGGVKKISATIISGGGNGTGCTNELKEGRGWTARHTGDRNRPDQILVYIDVLQGCAGGSGALMEVELDVTPGEDLQVVVGGPGGASSVSNFVCTGGQSGFTGKKWITSASPFGRHFDYDQLKKSQQAKGGVALGADRVQVKRFVNGIDGSIGAYGYAGYAPLETGSSSISHAYSRSYPTSFLNIRGQYIAFSKKEDERLNGDFSAKNYPAITMSDSPLPGPNPRLINDFPTAGAGGNSGTIGDFAKVRTDEIAEVSEGDKYYYKSYVHLTSTAPDGKAPTPGCPGIVIITY